MRIRRGGAKWRSLGCGGGVAVAIVASVLWGEAALVEEILTFEHIAVEGVADGAEVAHRDRSDEAGSDAAAVSNPARLLDADRDNEPKISREERILDVAVDLRLLLKTEGERERYIYPYRNQHVGWGREDTLKALQRRPDLVEELEQTASRIRPDWKKRFEKSAPSFTPALNPREFAPGQEVAANPSFVESGFRVEAFWAARTGTAAGQFLRAHFHPPDLSTGFEAQHLGNRSELHGIHIRSVDGRPFWLKRLRYRVTLNRQIPAKAYSIDGFNNFSVQVLVARVFDPRRSVREQFLAFPVGLPVGNDARLPWQTLQVFGFEFVKEVYIASSASVDIDDIAVVPLDAAP